MSDQPDKESRTEEPTEKRLAEAVERGSTPFSREMVTFGALLALTFALTIAVPWSAEQLGRTLRSILASAGEVRLDDREAFARFLFTFGTLVFKASVPVLALLAAGAVLASVVQNIPSFNMERISPKASRISPMTGFQRLYSKAGLIEFAKSITKLSVAIITVATVVWKIRGNTYRFMSEIQSYCLPISQRSS